MYPANNAIELNEQNLQKIIDDSHSKPLIISFWAPSMPETVDVNTLINTIVSSATDHILFATLNCEQEQAVAMQFGVRGLPTVAVFQNGQPVDGGSGPQTEQTLRDMISKYLPNQMELDFQESLKHIEKMEYSQALGLLTPLLTQDPNNNELKLRVAQCLVETQQFDDIETILSSVGLQDHNTLYKTLMAKLELHQQASNSPEIRQLELALEANPNDHNIAYELAIQYNQVNRNEEALSLLIKLLKQDINVEDGQVKKTTLDILSALGQGNSIASQYRRQLYALLY